MYTNIITGFMKQTYGCKQMILSHLKHKGGLFTLIKYVKTNLTILRTYLTNNGPGGVLYYPSSGLRR